MDWFERAKELKAQGYTNREIAEACGKALQTVKNRFHKESKLREGREEIKPNVEEHGEEYIVYSGPREVVIDKDKLRRLKQLYCEQKLTINQVCRELDIPRRDLVMIIKAFGI